MNIKPPVLVTARHRRFGFAPETDSMPCMAMYLRMIKDQQTGRDQIVYIMKNLLARLKRRQFVSVQLFKQ